MISLTHFWLFAAADPLRRTFTLAMLRMTWFISVSGEARQGNNLIATKSVSAVNAFSEKILTFPWSHPLTFDLPSRSSPPYLFFGHVNDGIFQGGVCGVGAIQWQRGAEICEWCNCLCPNTASILQAYSHSYLSNRNVYYGIFQGGVCGVGASQWQRGDENCECRNWFCQCAAVPKSNSLSVGVNLVVSSTNCC